MAENGGSSQRKKGGSVAEAQSLASIAPDMPAPERWEPGRYVLLADRFMAVSNGQDLQRGDVVEISRESEASRLGNAGAIARESSLEARRAQAWNEGAQAAIRAEELRREADELDRKYKRERGEEK